MYIWYVLCLCMCVKPIHISFFFFYFYFHYDTFLLCTWNSTEILYYSDFFLIWFPLYPSFIVFHLFFYLRRLLRKVWVMRRSLCWPDLTPSSDTMITHYNLSIFFSFRFHSHFYYYYFIGVSVWWRWVGVVYAYTYIVYIIYGQSCEVYTIHIFALQIYIRSDFLLFWNKCVTDDAISFDKIAFESRLRQLCCATRFVFPFFSSLSRLTWFHFYRTYS